MIRQTTKKDGLTLVEVMIALAVFGVSAAGIASATLLSGQIAQSNIHRNTAYTVVQGYAEQIKSIQYVIIESALNSPETQRIPTKGLTAHSTDSIEFDDPLTFGQRIEKEIVIDIQELDDGTYKKKIMPMGITANGQNLITGSAGVRAIEITLDFEWTTNKLGRQNTQQGSIRIVKTDVSEF